ncbi:MAG: NADP-dependent oxidoreductase [Edaphobacter sp.]
MSAGSTLPKTMTAAVIDAAGPATALQIRSVPTPQPIPGHVIIAVEYASIGPWDVEQRAGTFGTITQGTILGADGSGTIAAVGMDVEDVKVGDRVYSYSYGNPNGGFNAEYVSVPSDRVALVPPHLDMVVAGAMPCVALTALSGLETLKVKSGQTLFVFGASGGVGSFAVWLAKEQGATVIGTARSDSQGYVGDLGAAYAFDPNSPEREAVIRQIAPNGFDAALITTSSDTLADILRHLKTGASLAYPNGVEPTPVIEGHSNLAYDGEMSRQVMERLSAAIGSQNIPLKTEVFPLHDIVEAHERFERGHVVGKLVLRIKS